MFCLATKILTYLPFFYLIIFMTSNCQDTLAQSSALLVSHFSENNKFSRISKYLMVSILMATTCPTTEAALQAGLLPAQERRKGRFAKVSGRLKALKNVSDGLLLCIQSLRISPLCRPARRRHPHRAISACHRPWRRKVSCLRSRRIWPFCAGRSWPRQSPCGR